MDIAWLVACVLTIALVVVGLTYYATLGQTATPTTSPSDTQTSATSSQTTTTLASIGLSTPLTADRGSVIFSDNFKDPGSGWPKTELPTQTLSYGADGYVIKSFGSYVHLTDAPFGEPSSQLGVSITASMTVTAARADGFGVLCSQSIGSTNIAYAFVLRADLRWEIARIAAVTGYLVQPIKEGTAPVAAGAPATVTGMCATQPDNSTTRLTMFVNGSEVGDVTDTTTLGQIGWFAGISTKTTAGTSTVVATAFSVTALDR